MVTLDELRRAQERLRGFAVHTPLIPHTHGTSDQALWFKPENLQPIGTFKLRGAYNKLCSLSPEERTRGVITYSSGNHAQGVAYAAHAMGIKAVIVMPGNTPNIKVDATAALGAEIVMVGNSSVERRVCAEQLALEHGYTIIPPYNDEKIIAGQGTAGLEIAADLPDVDCVLVPVGGGGLISGVATALKLTRPHVKVIGVEPELANDAQRSFRIGTIVDLSANETARTIADGLRTQSVGEINFEHIQKYVDDIVTVTEGDIYSAMRHLALKVKLVAEPSGAVAFAAFLYQQRTLPPAANVVAVISGGNVEPGLLAAVLRNEPIGKESEFGANQ